MSRADRIIFNYQDLSSSSLEANIPDVTAVGCRVCYQHFVEDVPLTAEQGGAGGVLSRGMWFQPSFSGIISAGAKNVNTFPPTF